MKAGKMNDEDRGRDNNADMAFGRCGLRRDDLLCMGTVADDVKKDGESRQRAEINEEIRGRS